MLTPDESRLSPSQLAELKSICPSTRTDVSLASISRWKVGGPARLMVAPASVSELVAVRRFFAEHGLRHVVIGMTSNLLFSDSGLTVPCIQIGAALGAVDTSGHRVVAEAGVWVPGFARTLQTLGLSGAEHICGIPGTLGGLICMNGGSQRKAIGDCVVQVDSVDENGGFISRPADQCQFDYRTSVFQKSSEVIAKITFDFCPRDSAEIRREILSILKSRREKFPHRLPNCGSVFKSNPSMYEDVGPPGAVIESLGLKGSTEGGAYVSPMHANFIINSGSARATDILRLINRVQSQVLAATGHLMHAEAYFVGTDGALVPADQAAAALMEKQ